MKRTARKLSRFRSAEEAAKHLEAHSSAPFWNETKPVRVKVERPVRQMVSIRLELRLYNRLRQVAANKGLPYQTLIQQWLSERAMAELDTPSEATRRAAGLAFSPAHQG